MNDDANENNADDYWIDNSKAITNNFLPIKQK